MERIVIETNMETKKSLKDLAYKRSVTIKKLLQEMIENFLKKSK